MKIVLLDTHHYRHIKWHEEWIYIGSNYPKLKLYEDQISGKRISLCEQTSQQTLKQKMSFLEWIEQQRLKNNDSLHWWMTHLAGRNNMSSQFYSYICQVSALREWVLTQSDYSSDILIVCEDIFLLQTARKNLNDICTVTCKNSVLIGLVKETIYNIARGAYSLLCQCNRHIRHYRMAKKTRPRNLNTLSGEVHLIHQCLDDNSFRGDGKVSCRYFTVLPQWLEQQGKQIVGLAWFYNVNIPLEDAYRKLRASNALVPEDWLRPSDYVWSMIQSLKSVFSLKVIPYDGINCSSLVLRERLTLLGGESAQFWRYIPMLKRWGHDLFSLITYDHYENLLFEHPIRRTLRDFSFSTYSIGFYHALVSREFLGYHSIYEEWDSLVKPDIIVSNGLLGRNTLISQGAPKDRVIEGASLRNTFESNVNRINITGDLLILLSLSIESSMEMLDIMREQADWIAENLNVPVRVKLHPMMTPEYLLREIGWVSLPKAWDWELGEIQGALRQTRCCVTLMSASVYDAILGGCVVLPIKSELQQMDNYLDLFEDDFPEARSVPREKVRARMKEIFITKNKIFSQVFKTIQIKLVEGINPINDMTLKAFSYKEKKQQT